MILYGASGHGKVVAEILSSNGVQEIIFIDDNTAAKVNGRVVITPDELMSNSEVIVTVGLNHVRRNIVNKINNVKFGNAFHGRSIISESVVISGGSVVMAGAVINASCFLGRHVIVNTGSIIDHDCIISDFVHVSPNATLCGGVTVDEGSWIGAGAVIKNGLKIGKWVIIGAGAVVLTDVPDYSMVVGNPARVVGQNKDFL